MHLQLHTSSSLRTDPTSSTPSILAGSSLEFPRRSHISFHHCLMMLSSSLTVCSGQNCRRSIGQQRALRPSACRRVVVQAHGHPDGTAGGNVSTTEKPEKDKGFVREMRMVAMKLHTKEQAPKEGGQEAPKQGPWTPTRNGYVRFLAESKAVYDAMEQAVQDVDHPEYALFRKTGLERSQALAKDLEWFKETYNLEAPVLDQDGPGCTYARKVLDLAHKDPQAFICHFYNFYFAHTAGGRMIGNRVAGMLLDGYNLHFYQWEGDVNEHLDGVRRSINKLAESWTDEQKKHCLEETNSSFKYSGEILRCITMA